MSTENAVAEESNRAARKRLRRYSPEVNKTALLGWRI
jgi:citrate lyase beta subunit